MKKIIANLLLVIMVASSVACGNSVSETVDDTKTEVSAGDETTDVVVQGDTLGSKLAQTFLSEIKSGSSMEDIAGKLSEESEMDCMVVEASEGYLNGFTEEIKGFKSGVQFSPMIGSIPFVGYIFEVEDADGFKENLLAVADPRWNICTEAAETVCVTYENYVFFTMCPGDE